MSEFSQGVEVQRVSAELPSIERVKEVIAQNIQEIPPQKNRASGSVETKLRQRLAPFLGKPEVFAPIQMERKAINIDDPRFPEGIKGEEYFFFDRTIAIPEWRTLFSFSPRLKEVAFEAKGFKEISLVGMVDALTFVTDEQLFLEERLANGKKMLGKDFPALLPKGQTAILATYIQRYSDEAYSHTAIDNAAYCGVYGGVHYIDIDIRSDGLTDGRQNPVNPEANPYKTMTSFDYAYADSAVAHELIHQKTQEEFARQSGASPIKEIEDFSHLSANQVIKTKEGKIGMDENSLAAVVDEGFATYFDINLAKISRVRYLRVGGEAAKYNARHLGLISQNEATKLELELDSLVPNEGKVGDIHAYGYDLMKRWAAHLQKDPRQYVDKRLSEMVEKIDWVACNKIKKGTPEYNEILGDPTKIPMIKEDAIAQPEQLAA